MSLVQGVPSFLEAAVESSQSQHEQQVTEARLNKVYGVRASYIANTILNDSEHLYYFCIWLMVFATVIFGLHKLMKSTMTTKQSKEARQELDRAFSVENESATGRSSVYSELAASNRAEY